MDNDEADGSQDGNQQHDQDPYRFGEMIELASLDPEQANTCGEDPDSNQKILN
jgi:hypothetical protein